MSESGDTMGSLLPAAPASDDPDPEAPSVAIAIDNDGGGDTGLETRMARLLQAHAEEQHRLEQRLRQLEGLQIASVVAEAAASSAASAAASAASAEAAAKLVASAGEAVETAAAVMEATKLSLTALSADGAIPNLLAEHCVSAATAAKQHVTACLEDAREEAEDFIEETRKREQAAAVAAVAEKRGKKR